MRPAAPAAPPPSGTPSPSPSPPTPPPKRAKGGDSGASVLLDADGVIVIDLGLLERQGFIDATLKANAGRCGDEVAVCDVLLSVVMFRALADTGRLEFCITVAPKTALTVCRLCTTEIKLVPRNVTGGDRSFETPFQLANAGNCSELRRWSSCLMYETRKGVSVSGNFLLDVVEQDRFEDAFGEVLDLCVAAAYPSAVIPSLFVQVDVRQTWKPVVSPTEKEESLNSFTPKWKTQLVIAQAGDRGKYLDKTAISNASGSKGLRPGLRRAGRAYTSEEVKDSLACAVSYLGPDGKKNPDSVC
jgi:hypothetical protein